MSSLKDFPAGTRVKIKGWTPLTAEEIDAGEFNINGATGTVVRFAGRYAVVELDDKSDPFFSVHPPFCLSEELELLDE